MVGVPQNARDGLSPTQVFSQAVWPDVLFCWSARGQLPHHSAPPSGWAVSECRHASRRGAGAIALRDGAPASHVRGGCCAGPLDVRCAAALTPLRPPARTKHPGPEQPTQPRFSGRPDDGSVPTGSERRAFRHGAAVAGLTGALLAAIPAWHGDMLPNHRQAGTSGRMARRLLLVQGRPFVLVDAPTAPRSNTRRTSPGLAEVELSA